jgi:soluble lytic murein transglycosylase-like protein
MRSRLLPVLVLACLAWGGGAWAQGVYKYVERDGTVVYTNLPPPGVQARLLGKSTRRHHRIERVTGAQFDEYIDAAAEKYNIPRALLRAIMHAESHFDPKAVSQVGASGLMQLMPDTAQKMYVHDIFDIEENIDGGARYLRVLANRYSGDMITMVAAYNAGPKAVDKYGGNVPPFPETQSYVRKVIALYFDYKERLKAVSAR